MRPSSLFKFISLLGLLLVLDHSVVLLAAPTDSSHPITHSTNHLLPVTTQATHSDNKRNAEHVIDLDNDESEEIDEEESDEEEEDEEEVDVITEVAKSLASTESDPKEQKSVARILTDIFGNQIKLENNRTILLSQNKARDLGLLTIKAILLGPLIGLTIKAALIRGLLWAIGAYFLHLFFPGVLSALGLGTGLVGFARQAQPSLATMLMPQLAHVPNNIHNILPTSLNRMVTQYRQTFVPVVDSIRSIPEGHCRFRAVCETASQLIRNTQFMSTTLQRLSATVYLNFGTDYSKAWLDGIVQSDCAVKYPQCDSSPLNLVTSKLAEVIRPNTMY